MGADAAGRRPHGGAGLRDRARPGRLSTRHGPDGVTAEPVALGTAAGRWLLAACVLASGTAFLDATAVNVALPSIGRELGSSLSGLQWTVTAYTLTLAALILLGGSLGDRYGRRRVFLVGVTWFAAASLLCGLAQGTGELAAARAVQGAGGALLVPGSLALVQSSFRPADRARAIGLWSALGGVAGLVGPFLGGALVDLASWRLVFWVNLPVAALVVVLGLRHVPAGHPVRGRGRFDVPGALLGALALGGVTYALIRAGDSPAGPGVPAGALVGVAAAAGFVVRERRARDPMLPLGLFTARAFTGANLATFAVYGALGGLQLFLVLELQTVLGYSAAQAGAAVLPAIALVTLLSSRAGALATRIGPRLPMTVGPLLAACGALVLSRVVAGQPYWAGVLPGLLLQGLGMATTVAPLTATVLAAAPDPLAGVASGVNNAVARAAQLLAVAALPVAVGLSGRDYADPAALAAGYRAAALACAGLFALGGLVSWLTIRSQPRA